MIEKSLERLLFACRWLLAPLYLMLVGSLIVMVMFPGYENFVSKIDIEAGTLTLKVAASIVAISSIHLLRVFMNAHQTDNDKIMWYVILHLTFVVSAVLLGVLDRMAFASHRKA